MFDHRASCILGLVLATFVYTVSGVCEDSVTKKNPIKVLDANQKVIGKAKSCAILFKKWPSLCEKTDGNLTIGGDGGKCCATCGDTTCLDKLGKSSDFKLDGKKIKSCAQLVAKYPGLCVDEGQPGGQCCRACDNVDTSCVDNPLKRFTSAGLTCAQYIKQDSCRCATVSDDCCASCKDVDTSALGCDCRDILTKANPATIAITNPMNGETVVSKDVDNCKEIVQYYAQFCKNLGARGCCESCQGVDPDCKDNLLWKGSISFRGNTCNDCTCHDIRKTSKALMKKACKDNIKGDGGGHKIQTACCLQCSRVGIPQA